jgi:FkbM family methyltransferase
MSLNFNVPDSPYLKNMVRLNNFFDKMENRERPLIDREPITALLELYLEDIIASFAPDLFLEVGAFEASFSRRMKSRYPKTPVYAIEANPRVHQHFRAVVEASGVNYIHMAADSEQGEATFFIPDFIDGKKMPYAGRMGSLHEVSLRASQSSLVKVSAQPIDDLVASVDSDSICMWLDVEGALKRVLDGACKTLSRTSILFCELESSPVWKDQSLAPEIALILAKAGLFPIARDCQKWFQHNVIFIKSDMLENEFLASSAKKYADKAIELFSG